MAHFLAGLLALMHLLPSLGSFHAPDPAAQRLRSGQWLRFHVIAQDDTDDMQRVKLLVRDAVQACYAQNCPPEGSMLSRTEAILPLLTLTAGQAARDAGFSGSVYVSLGPETFDERQLGSTIIPAGSYPALVIRLGEARGQNWWGLIDPEAALRLAAVTGPEDAEADAPVVWDWSWQALLCALLGLPPADS